MGEKFDSSLARGIANITRRALGPYQTAIVRIGFAFVWLTFMLRELPYRHELYGPDSPWGHDLAVRLLNDNHAFTVLLWTDNRAFFEFVYLAGIAVCFALLLGWRTRLMTVLFMVVVLSLQNRSVFMGDGGDNVVHLMALYLVLSRCSQVWSLDARRARRNAERGVPATRDPVGVLLWALCGAVLAAAQLTGFATTLALFDENGPVLSFWIFPGLGWGGIFWGLWLIYGGWWAVRRFAPGEPRLVGEMVANIIHNAGLLVIMVQVCIIYSAAGWYKIQGSRWQDGTAVHYPLNLDYFTPWPDLTERLGNVGMLVMLLTYGTVFVQVAFPFALLNRKAKNILLFLMIGEHVGIAVLLGLPFFSLAMIAMDSVFLPTVFLIWMGHQAGRAGSPVLRLFRRRSKGPEPDTPVTGSAPAPATASAPGAARPDEPRIPAQASPDDSAAGQRTPGTSGGPGGEPDDRRPAWADRG
ncbi:HTTM domain-containing protein [Streptomyces sp. YIM 98790]|uniref:HTTM domain-containing protein n=1 Tax=Streptomyces sp. YIM 98790 TaxID=2689077 RepID=UPI001FB70ECA|nr:HTTM domain-containing protein [Streptomyces sp. YIM 98790]